MKLHVKRSTTTKGKLLGGSDTFYVLQLRADFPADELALLARYHEESFSRSDGLIEMQVEKKIEGPEHLSVEALTRGVEYRAKAVYKALAGLPEHIVEEYQSKLGRVRAHESWPGEETLAASLN